MTDQSAGTIQITAIPPAGNPILLLHTAPQSPLVPHCYLWQAATHNLRPVSCEGQGGTK